jgi:hypothetical protein
MKITEERNQRRYKKMERSPILMNWQNHYCENSYTAKSDLYVQSNSHQNSNDTLHRNREIDPKVHMEAQKTLNNQSNPEQKQQC